MNSIADYIRWLGRFSFAELPVSEVDIFVMCVISYFNLGPAFERGGDVTVADCTGAIDENRLKLLITGGDMGNAEIFREAAASRRFGTLRITDYEDVLKPEVPLQFSACTFRDGDERAFICFRGTDETIAGWKEDFMISFTLTEAQTMAAAYAERMILADPAPRYYIAGHSKGGNLALYAACMLSGAAWERLERVYILDGPGLCPEVMDISVLARVNGKTTRIIPEFDVVGSLFAPRITDTRIIRSSAKGILQHSLATWGVHYGAIAAAKENDKASSALMLVLDRWISGIDQHGRRLLTDDIFDTLAAGGAVTLSDIANEGASGFEAVLARMFQTSPVTRRIMLDLPARMFTTLGELLRDRVTPRREEEKEEEKEKETVTIDA